MYIESKINIKREDRVNKDDVERNVRLLAKVAGEKDKEAFGELFSYYAPRLKALLMKQGSGAELAEDLMQDTMLAVWQKAEQFSNWRGNLNAWIFTIARNKRIDRFRKQGVQHYLDIEDFDFADDRPDGEMQIESVQRDAIVNNATSALPDEQKQVILLAYVEELSQSEIAKKLKIPLGTVKSRTRLAFQSIRKELEEVL